MCGAAYKKGEESPSLPVAFKLFDQYWHLLTGVKGFREHTLKLARRVARKMDRCPEFFRSASDLKVFLIRQVTMDRREFDREERRQGSSCHSVQSEAYGGLTDEEGCHFMAQAAAVNHDFPVELSGTLSSYAKELVAQRSPITVELVRERFNVERAVAMRILSQVRMELEEELLCR